MIPPPAALLLLPALPLAAAAVVLFTGRFGTRAPAAVGLLTAGVSTLLAAWLAGSVLGGTTVSARIPWVPEVGLALSFRLDGLALLFALLIAGIGVLVFAYAHAYMPPADPLPRFHALLLCFMGAMLGVVCADNLLLLVVFWELTSVVSFLLIGFRDEDPAARRGALQSLIVTGLGGLALLAGVLVLGRAAGTFEIAELQAGAAGVRALPGAAVALGLILVGAFTKSAQWPFHFWLPGAMAAPTPVSTYLHSATMVKAGVFLLARLHPIFGETELWRAAVTSTGALTLLVGGWGALRHTELKALLAYSTISQLGLMTMFLGYGTAGAALGAVFHVLNHAAFKAPLFMAAGIVDHETGERDLRRVGGLARLLPRTALVAGIGAAGMMGIPLVNGFLSKELLFEAGIAALHEGARAWVLLGAVAAGSVFTVAYSLRFWLGVFGGPLRPPGLAAHEAPAGLWAPAAALAALCLAVGIVPDPLVGGLLGAATGAVVGVATPVHVKVWHGLTPALGLSMAVLAAGAALYAARRGAAPPRARAWPGAADLYDRAVTALLAGAGWLTDRYQTGDLRLYVRVMLVAALLAGAGGLAASATGAGAAVLLPPTPLLPGAITLTAVTVAAALGVVVSARHRVTSVVALGAVGLLLAVFFAWLSAPDLVLTQLLVEVVTTLLILLVLYFMPRRLAVREPRGRLLADGTLAGAAGAGVGLAAYLLMRRPFASISDFHTFHSVPLAGGSNVVNVILVDYRGYDTLGEIAVLATAAVGILGIARARRRTP